MKKMLIIEKCNQCKSFERNMYHGECCWHDNVVTLVPEGKIPKQIESLEYIVDIPMWCPLEELK